MSARIATAGATGTGTVHVVGAGLAGLAAALALSARGRSVRLWEATDHAGGRCRSFEEPTLGRRIDNGNHLIMSGNVAAMRHIERIGAKRAIRMADPTYPFADLETGSRWQVRLTSRVPFWVLDRGRRVPGTRLSEYGDVARLAAARPGATVADAVRGRGALWRRFWEPMTWAVLNALPERATASLLWRVFAETMMRGPEASRPLFADQGLGEALIEPAIALLDAEGAAVAFNAPLAGVETEGDRATRLRFAERDPVALGPHDRVVLAVPPHRLRALLPGMAEPPENRAAILNAHFVLPPEVRADRLPTFLGLVGATAHWLFRRGDVVSVTVSAADALGVAGADKDALLDRLWRDVDAALHLGGLPRPPGRILTERRATFDQSPAGVAKRPQARTVWQNVVLAGDFTQTGLPATIEGALRSGETAAHLSVSQT